MAIVAANLVGISNSPVNINYVTGRVYVVYTYSESSSTVPSGGLTWNLVYGPTSYSIGGNTRYLKIFWGIASSNATVSTGLSTGFSAFRMDEFDGAEIVLDPLVSPEYAINTGSGNVSVTTPGFGAATSYSLCFSQAWRNSNNISDLGYLSGFTGIGSSAQLIPFGTQRLRMGSSIAVGRVTPAGHNVTANGASCVAFELRAAPAKSPKVISWW